MSYGSSDVITVFGFFPYDRSGKVCWLLEELGVPYRRETIEFMAGSETPEYLAMNPMGTVPVLKRGNFTMFEGGAICAFLADEFPERKLAPPPGDPERAAYLQWSYFGTGTLEHVTEFIDAFDDVPEAARPAVFAHFRERLTDALAMLDRHFSSNQYALGNRFSAADIALAYPLYGLEQSGKLESYSSLVAYFERLKLRPAAVRARFFSYTGPG